MSDVTYTLTVTMPTSVGDLVQPALFRMAEAVEDALLDYGVPLPLAIRLDSSLGEKILFEGDNTCGG